MIKEYAKRNRRQRKKLRVGEWIQREFEISVGSCVENYDIDYMYDSADLFDCFLFGVIDEDVSYFRITNNAEYRKILECLSDIQGYLLCSGYSVSISAGDAL